MEYKFTRRNKCSVLSINYTLKIQWILVEEHFQQEMEKLESINPCVDNLIEYFGLINFVNVIVGSDEFVKSNRSWRKWELIMLFFKYKNLQEKTCLDITDFINLLIKGAQTESIYLEATAQLVGFRTSLMEIKIGNFTIRMPSEQELNRILNEHELFSIDHISNPSDIASCSFICESQFWIFMEAQQARKKDLHVIRMLYQQSELYNDSDTTKIRSDFKRLILALRLHNGNYTGIRSIFINKSFIYENHFDPWREHQLLDSEFCNFRKIQYSYNLKSKEIFSDDVIRINTLFEKLMLYESNRLEQIDRALDHFFNAFEENYAVFTFTELIMTLETILLENVKTNPDEKHNLIKKIRDAENEDDGLRILKEYNEKNSIPKAIKLLNQLLNPEKRNKSLNKFFLDYENNGCYKIRNDLIHGNIELDFAEIRKKIPDLEEYVRLALLKIIDLRIGHELNCNEENYFEKLHEILKT